MVAFGKHGIFTRDPLLLFVVVVWWWSVCVCFCVYVCSSVAVIAEMRGQGLAMDADAYNIAINKLTQRDLAAAEALLVKMTNANIMPNAKTMDYFLRGFASQGEGAAGVSMVQSCFNMYQVRPSQDAFMRVVEKFGKVYMYQVRLEYHAHGDAAFRSGRAQVLRGFLSAPSLYSTPDAQRALEPQARRNLAAEIQRLEA